MRLLLSLLIFALSESLLRELRLLLPLLGQQLTDSDFNPCQPLNLANSPPFLKILPRCPSISPASWGDRTGLCYAPDTFAEPGDTRIGLVLDNPEVSTA